MVLRADRFFCIFLNVWFYTLQGLQPVADYEVFVNLEFSKVNAFNVYPVILVKDGLLLGI